METAMAMLMVIVMVMTNLHGLCIPQHKVSVAVCCCQQSAVGRKSNARDSSTVTIKFGGRFEDTPAFQGEDADLWQL